MQERESYCNSNFSVFFVFFFLFFVSPTGVIEELALLKTGKPKSQFFSNSTPNFSCSEKELILFCPCHNNNNKKNNDNNPHLTSTWRSSPSSHMLGVYSLVSEGSLRGFVGVYVWKHVFSIIFLDPKFFIRTEISRTHHFGWTLIFWNLNIFGLKIWYNQNLAGLKVWRTQNFVRPKHPFN